MKTDKNKRKKISERDCLAPSAASVTGEPEDVFDMVNKYGTYNIQPTAQTENSFPYISQGLPKKKQKQQKELTSHPAVLTAVFLV